MAHVALDKSIAYPLLCFLKHAPRKIRAERLKFSLPEVSHITTRATA
jgi:hypothetical protein